MHVTGSMIYILSIFGHVGSTFLLLYLYNSIIIINLIDYRRRCNANSNWCLQTVLEGKNVHVIDNVTVTDIETVIDNVTVTPM